MKDTMEHDKMINLHVTRQTFDFDCGVKALQTVMAYYGVHVREDKLIKELGADQEGARVERMIAVAEAKGFRVQAKEHMTIAELKRNVENGTPVIILLQAWAERPMTHKDWESDVEDGHYAIVIGYQERRLIFEDPASFHRTWLSEQEFALRWHDLDANKGYMYQNFGMVLLGKEPLVHSPRHMD